MALPLQPRFCPVHQKIHICELMDTNNLNKAQEMVLGKKIRKLHGIQTEEEKQAELEKKNPPKGSLAAILANAKKNNQKIKTKLGIASNNTSSLNDSSDGSETKKVSEAEIGDRMSLLRSKIGINNGVNTNISQVGEVSKPPIQKKSPVEQTPKVIKTIDKSVIEKKKPTSTTTLQDKELILAKAIKISERIIKKEQERKQTATKRPSKSFSASETQEIVRNTLLNMLKDVEIKPKNKRKK